MKEQSDSRSWRRALVWIGFIVAVLPGFIAFNIFDEHSNRDRIELESVKAKLTLLKRAIGVHDSEKDQHSSDRRVLFRFLNECREAVDIPKLPGGKVLTARSRSGDRLNLFVPKGSHTLHIAAWYGAVDLPSSELERQDWALPLIGDAGYRMTIKRIRIGETQTVGWTVKSSSQDFETESVELPLMGFKTRMDTRGNTHDVCAYPNEVSCWSYDPDSHRLKLLTYWLTGRKLRAYFEVSLESKADAVVRSGGAIGYHREGGSLKRYEGGGRFTVLSVPVSTDATP